LFDQNGDGIIDRRELREGFNALNIGLKLNEIDDLMTIVSTRPDGKISYDDFIAKMDANIRHRHEYVKTNVDEALFKKINDCLVYSGESLFEAMKYADMNDSDTIVREDLARVFKRLGLSTIEPNLPTIMKIGGVTDKQERIDIYDFSKRFNAELTK
jgi:Ca2+-binding EF-hand superfamily protein